MLNSRKVKSSSQIRPINFLQDSQEVVRIIAEGFEYSPTAQQVDFDRYVWMAERKSVRLALDVLHRFLTRSAEMFIWENDGEIFGIGTAQRVRFNDKKEWMLTRFAINRRMRMNLLTVAAMRGLMRRAIDHAFDNGAIAVEAHVREDNPVPYKLCLQEGFRESGEVSVYEMTHYRRRTDECRFTIDSCLAIIRLRPTLIDKLLMEVLGYKRTVLEIRSGTKTLAEVEVLNYQRTSAVSTKVEIRPVIAEEYLQMLKYLINDVEVRKTFEMAARTSIVLPTPHPEIREIMEEQEAVEIARLKKLVLNRGA